LKTNPNSSSIKQSPRVGQIPDAASAERPHSINGQGAQMERVLNQPGDTKMRDNSQEASKVSVTKSRPEPTKVGGGASHAGQGDQAFGGVYNKIY